MKRRRWTDQQLEAAVLTNNTIAGCLEALGLRPAGGNYASIHRHINRLGLDTSHFLTKEELGAISLTNLNKSKSLSNGEIFKNPRTASLQTVRMEIDMAIEWE